MALQRAFSSFISLKGTRRHTKLLRRADCTTIGEAEAQRAERAGQKPKHVPAGTGGSGAGLLQPDFPPYNQFETSFKQLKSLCFCPIPPCNNAHGRCCESFAALRGCTAQKSSRSAAVTMGRGVSSLPRGSVLWKRCRHWGHQPCCSWGCSGDAWRQEMPGEVRGCAARWCCSRHTWTAQIPPSSYTLPWGWSRCPGGFSKPPRAAAAGPALQARLQQQVSPSPAHTFPSERHPLLPRRTPCSHPARPAPKSPAWSQPWAHVHEAGDGAMGWGRCHMLGLGSSP